MSFNVDLYTNSSPSNKVGKDLELVFANTTGVLREGTSIIAPVITIQTSVPADVITKVNYADISAFGRKYFVTDIISLTNDLWEIHLHVDVLETYASKIKELNAVVSRQEFSYNLYLDDGWFMAYQNPIVETHNFSNLTPFNVDEFILVLAGS